MTSKLFNNTSKKLEFEKKNMNLKGSVTNFIEVTNNKIVESLELKKLAEEIGLDFAENKDNLKKFYGI